MDPLSRLEDMLSEFRPLFNSKTRKYVYTLKSNNSVNTLARWRGFLTSPM